MAKFCAHCGKPLEPGVKFCPGCGRPVEDAANLVLTEMQALHDSADAHNVKL